MVDLRTALIVSPYFPPSTVAGVHRARHLAKHLPDAGWKPVIMCVDERYHVERLDPALAQLLPHELETIKVRAIPEGLTRVAGFGDISIRAWPYLRRAMKQILTRRKIDVVLITGAPFYPMLLGRMIREQFKRPLVLDFQDPWVWKFSPNDRRWSKMGLSHLLARNLEPIALRSASYITSVSDVQNEEMAARYPWLNSKAMAGIPIGGDPDDFSTLRTVFDEDATDDLEPGKINVSYVGTFLPTADSVFSALFRGFRKLRDETPQLADRIRLKFFGTSNNSNDKTSFRARSLAAAQGVADAVNEVPERLPYLRSLGILARSHALLLLGSSEPHYTASKIYPALMSKRPYLSIYHRASSSHAILSAAGGGRALAFAGADELASLEQPIAEALRTLVLNPDSVGAANPIHYAPYEAKSIAKRYADIFDSIVKRAPAYDA